MYQSTKSVTHKKVAEKLVTDNGKIGPQSRLQDIKDTYEWCAVVRRIQTTPAMDLVPGTNRVRKYRGICSGVQLHTYFSRLVETRGSQLETSQQTSTIDL